MIVWVIEFDDSKKPIYFNNTYARPVAPYDQTWTFTTEFNDAAKYETKDAAERCLDQMPMSGDLFVCDHEIVEDSPESVESV